MEVFREAFLDYLKIERGLSKNSLLSYELDLKKYLDYLEKRGVTEPSRVAREDITDFLFQCFTHQFLFRFVAHFWFSAVW